MKNIASPFTLPNGSILKNRIAKIGPMSENIGTLSNALNKKPLSMHIKFGLKEIQGY